MIRRRISRILRPLVRRPAAYRVPWQVERAAAPHYRIRNTGDDTLRGVTVSVFGTSRFRVAAPAIVRPGGAIHATTSGPDPARDTIVVVRWFAPDGAEYLWQVSF
ncbi:MAG TPA: hypothetical protein VGI08_07590 [Diaminobutyricibacter sp.]|uniref:hypothetical protein n=1 Tax=Leifsonia sp. McL0618 TaxID=3415677 RepID=UPI0033848C8F